MEAVRRTYAVNTKKGTSANVTRVISSQTSNGMPRTHSHYLGFEVERGEDGDDERGGAREQDASREVHEPPLEVVGLEELLHRAEQFQNVSDVVERLPPLLADVLLGFPVDASEDVCLPRVDVRQGGLRHGELAELRALQRRACLVAGRL